MVTAREHVRVAGVLRRYSLLRTEFQAGRLSYARVRAVSRVITPTSEDDLVRFARAATASQLERFAAGVARAKLAADSDAADVAFNARRLELRPCDDNRWELRASIPAETAVLLRTVLQRFESTVPSDETSAGRSFAQRRADAFIALVAQIATHCPDGTEDIAPENDDAGGANFHSATPDCASTDSDSDPSDLNTTGSDTTGSDTTGSDTTDSDTNDSDTNDSNGPARNQPEVAENDSAESSTRPGKARRRRNGRHTAPNSIGTPSALLIVHRYPDGAELGQHPIPTTTADRLACDCAAIILDHNSNGDPLNFGRQRRSPTAAQRRAVLARDQRCRFPGCNHRANVQVHHVKEWQHNGTTDLVNLIGLCGWHHRIIHDQHWIITGDPNGELTFTKPGTTTTRGLRYPIPRSSGHLDIEASIGSLGDPYIEAFAIDNETNHTGHSDRVDERGEPIIQQTDWGRFDLELAVWAHLNNENVRNNHQPKQPTTENDSAESSPAAGHEPR